MKDEKWNFAARKDDVLIVHGDTKTSFSEEEKAIRYIRELRTEEFIFIRAPRQQPFRLRE